MKKLLLVIDYQKDFVDGSLGFEKAVSLYEGICGIIKEYQKNNDDIIYTLDTHFNDYADTQEGRKLPVKHCIKGSEGHKLYGDLKKLLINAKCFEKNTFASRELMEYLIDNPYDEITLVGLVSNICVISNAIIAKTACPEAEIRVLSKLTASFDDTMNEKAMDVMRGLQIEVV